MKDTMQRSLWIGGPAGSCSELLCSVSFGVWQIRTGTLVVRAQLEPQNRKAGRRSQGSVPEKIISLSLPSPTLTIPCSLLPLYKIGLWGTWVAGDRGRETAYHVFGRGWPREEPSGSFAENQGMWEGRCSQNESSEAVSGQPESEQRRAPEMLWPHLNWLIHTPRPPPTQSCTLSSIERQLSCYTLQAQEPGERERMLEGVCTGAPTK